MSVEPTPGVSTIRSASFASPGFNHMAPCKGMAAGKALKAETRKNQMTETDKLTKRRKPGDCRRAGNAATPPKRVETRQQASSAAL